ncbi:MAG: TatD family hydrolase [Candidatus Colwellbacteria bacterium]|nr:TatD family hydrolase [Candidatus Colwellbacteria bacterium]
MPKLIDAHTHVQFAAYDNDWKEVIDRSLAQNTWLVNVGTQKDTSAKAVEIAEKYSEGVYATVGLHPIHTEKSHHDSQELGNNEEAKGFSSRGEGFDYEYYKGLNQNEKVVAVGECGLDYYRLTEETKEKQAEVFEAQINLAAEIKKPLMIHCRQAYSDLINILNNQKPILGNPSGIIHFFSGTKENAKELLNLGFYFSFGGVVTFVRDYDEVIKSVGLDKIVLETDAPYVTPVPHRGKRNEPAYVKYVAEKLAEILGKDSEEVAAKTTQNACDVLKI